MENEKDLLLAQIKSLAEVNLAYEPTMIEGKDKIQELSERGEQLSKTIEEKQQEISKRTYVTRMGKVTKYSFLENNGGGMTTEDALELLQAAAAEQEEESEKIAMKFLDNALEIEEFLQQFTEARKVMHLRKVKADKLSELVRRRPNNVPNYVNAPPVTVNSNYFPTVPLANPMPYPAYPSVGMPMPGSYFANNF